MSDQRKEDLELLRRVIAAIEDLAEECDNDEDVPPREGEDGMKARAAFVSMLARLSLTPSLELTEKQRKWVQDYDEKTGGGIHYENLISSGKAPRGLREVPTPAVLQNLPKKPPGARPTARGSATTSAHPSRGKHPETKEAAERVIADMKRDVKKT